LIARGRVVVAIVLAGAVQLVHLAQPDTSQAAAFAVGATALLLTTLGPRSALAVSGSAVVSVLALVTGTRRDPLAPVPEVEGIVGLAHDVAPWMGVLAVVTCALLAVPFVLWVRAAWMVRGPAGRAASLALCGYVITQLLTPLVLHVPVPVLGYGASTVLTYAAACTAGVAITSWRGAERRLPEGWPAARRTP
jgi:hypothetical protein